MSDPISAKTPDGDTHSDDTLVETSDDFAATSDECGSESEDSFLRAVAQAPAATPPSAEPDLTGTELSKYRIVEEIGRGGMGIVYAAEDTKLRRRVALKVLPARFAADPERRQRFLREARAASAVTHPNIATVYDVDEAAGSVYIAMELVEGRTLRRMLEAGPLAQSEALRIACEILRGLSRAHEVGIIHRDLKPDNVMVTPNGSVKLLDFGLAKPMGTREPAIAEDGTSSDVATLEGRVLGTPSYMSPEQAKGRPVDARSDLFSFGVLFYEMLAGRRPFTADGTVELLIAIDRDPPPRLSSVVAVPRALERVVERCLAKQPEDRFADCAEVIALIELGAAPTRSHRRTLLAVAVLMIALGGLAWVFTRPSPGNALGPDPLRATPSSEHANLPSKSVSASSAAPVPAAESAASAPGSASVRPRSAPLPRATPAPSKRTPDPLADQK